ncbi:VOC family protein [Sorangium sp. So ce1014]|uniref:VOC family protein n=1 Tax=unclassified Sorangium TaxID=2621164 RepID=UPI003F615C2D
MHKSRLAGFIIDCRTDDLDGAASFWSAALGMRSRGRDGEAYVRLDAAERDLVVEVQGVKHGSRVHLDIETDDIEAEVRRLERLGAKRVTQAGTWWVLDAPTGQRFCVVKAPRPDAPGFSTWDDEGNPL